MSEPQTSPNQSNALAPVAPEERLVVLDVLRGFALFGILIMNMSWFKIPGSAWALEPRLFPGFGDRAAQFVMEFLVGGKANSIFSFLFGLGMTIQMQRAAARGTNLVPAYLRRLAVLLVIGLLHLTLLWIGDVLHVYAVLGLVLLAMRRASDKTVFIVIALSVVAPVLRSAWGLYHNEPPPHPMSYYVDLAHEHMRVFREGSYAEQVAARIGDIKEGYERTPRLQGWMWIYVSFNVTMLLGFYAGRKRLFEDVKANAARIRKVMWWCLALGLAAAVGFAILKAIHRPTGQPTVKGFFISVFFNVNRPLLCVAYIGAITLLFQRERAQRLLMPLAHVGRMPLTNYLMQSAIATTLFYSHGFGLFGTMGPALGLLVVVAIFAVQIVYSRWWMERFRFGPLEWLWRGATYGKLPPLRVTPRPS